MFRAAFEKPSIKRSCDGSLRSIWLPWRDVIPRGKEGRRRKLLEMVLLAKRLHSVFGIPKYQHFPKASLAPYPDEDGNPLWVGEKESLDELQSLNPKNSEMLARPGMGVCLAAAAMDHGARDLVRGAAKKAVSDMSAFLTAGSAKPFLEAVRVLNLGKTGTASRSAVEKAKYVAFMQKNDEAMQAALVNLIGSAGRLYLLGMHLVEQRAFFGKLGSWAKKWRNSPGNVAALEKWLKELSNQSKLETSLVKLLLEKIGNHGDGQERDAESPPSSLPGSPSGKGSSSSPSKPKTKKLKKSKKKEKKEDKKEKNRKRKRSASPRSPPWEVGSRVYPTKMRACTSTVQTKRSHGPKARRSRGGLKDWPVAEAQALQQEVEEGLRLAPRWRQEEAPQLGGVGCLAGQFTRRGLEAGWLGAGASQHEGDVQATAAKKKWKSCCTCSSSWLRGPPSRRRRRRRLRKRSVF